MEVEDQTYFNFINSLNSEYTKQVYAHCLKHFLIYCKLDLAKFLKLPQGQIENLITEYLVGKKASKASKDLILATIKHACDMNDVLGVNWKKIKKFTRSVKTGNEILGRDRGYEHKEIAQILQFSDQRLKTAFLILASTGMRIGGLSSLKVGDLEHVQDIYKVTVYSGETEQYITFTTPEAAKEIDAYLDFRRRRGEHITSDSYVMVKKFKPGDSSNNIEHFSRDSLRAILQICIINTGLRQIDHDNIHKRKQVPLLTGFRKFFTKQLMDSKVDKAIVELLLGHDIGLTGRYYRPTEKEMLNEYMKAIPLLTISNEERLKFKLEERITIERTQLETLQKDFEKFKKDIMKRRK